MHTLNLSTWLAYHRFSQHFGLGLGSLPEQAICALAEDGMVLIEDVRRLARVWRHAEFVHAEPSPRWRAWADSLPEVPLRLPLLGSAGLFDLCLRGSEGHLGRFDPSGATVRVEQGGVFQHSYAL